MIRFVSLSYSTTAQATTLVVRKGKSKSEEIELTGREIAEARKEQVHKK